MVDSITLRPATEADYPEVIKLLDDPRDYLPSKYHSFLKDTNRNLVTFKSNGKVVGFTLGYTVDDGQTIVGQAARISKSHQKLGIWRHLRRAEKMYLEKPNLKYMATVFSDWKANMNIPGTKLLMKRSYIRLEINAIRGLVNAIKPNMPQDLTHQQTASLLANPDVKWQLFPHGFVIVNAVPYSINCPGNFEKICQNTCKALCSGGESGCLSFGSYHEAPAGLVYYCDFYGSSLSDLESHTVQHILHADSIHKQGKLFVNVYFPPNIDGEEFLGKLQQFEGQIKCVDDKTREMYFSRYPIPKPTSKI